MSSSTGVLSVSFVGHNGVLAAGIVVPVLCVLVVVLRFWVRVLQRAKLGLDDYTIFGALLLVIGMSVCIIYGTVKHSLGSPTPKITNASLEATYNEIAPAQRLVQLLDGITWLLMIPANGLIKLSAVLLYRRIFVVNKGSHFDIVSKGVLVLCAVWTVAFLLASIFGCGKHFSYAWNALKYDAACHTNPRLNGLMISDLITDILVWVLPIPMVWKLHVGRVQKISLTGIFLLAAVSIGAAAVRLCVQMEISKASHDVVPKVDFDLALTLLLFWSLIESGLALISTCLPTLAYLIHRPTLHSVVSSTHIKLYSVRSPLTSLQRTTSHEDGPYAEILVTKKISQNSQRDEESAFDPFNLDEGEHDNMLPPLLKLRPDECHFRSSIRGNTGSV